MDKNYDPMRVLAKNLKKWHNIIIARQKDCFILLVTRLREKLCVF
jgi:hypothetical protein